MGKVLVQFGANYADEFDIGGFDIFDEEWWEEYTTQTITDDMFPTSRYFGSNQDLEFKSKRDYLSYYYVTPITDVEADILNRLFPRYSRGRGKFMLIE